VEKFRDVRLAVSFLSHALCASTHEAILMLFLKLISKHLTKAITGGVTIITTAIFKLSSFFFHQLAATREVVLEFNVM
jgi:hypothetical protein